MKRYGLLCLMMYMHFVMFGQKTDLSIDNKMFNLSSETDSIPNWAINYDAWAGNYDFMICSSTVDGQIDTIDVVLEPLPDRSGYKLTGVNSNYPIMLNFNKKDNSFELQPQVVGEPLANGNVVLLAGWAKGPGYVHYGLYTTATASGMKAYWSEDEQMYKWTDNGKWRSYKMNAYILYVFNGTTRVGQISLSDEEQAKYAINGAARIYSLEGLKPKFKRTPVKVSINPSAIVMTTLGDMTQLELEILPDNVSDKSVTWSSSNTGVCVVTQNGTLIATGNGTSVVIAITNDGSIPATCIVTVDTTLSGIDEAIVSEEKAFDVYSVSGVLMRKDVSTLEGLPRGIYIVNGRKVVVK
ncbi:MAG: Ig-like domain-containing protein [Prevotella sp.]|nr:Ig-like domain-containing protein [Prevotella sp.]